MAKKTKVPRDNEEQDEDVRRALRTAYEVDRWQWLSGNKPLPPMSPGVVPAKPTPATKPAPAKAPRQRVLRVLPQLYPNGTEGIPTSVIARRVAIALKPESDELGLPDPSLTTVKRALGRR
jgi:hypothetical protein